MNILVVYQSVGDMGAFIFMLLITVVKVDRTRMSRKSGDSRVVASRISKQEGPGSIPGGGKEVS